jgi:2-polyprenyl-3-methyl-5-hydroxy-6-metoxy-1,4-benzoquinol methylase
MAWKDEQHFEKNWHGNCVNSYWEETKQIVYAKRIGLKADMSEGKYPVYDLKNISVLDIGGGAYSMLLKCINFQGTVVDPCDYPQWTRDRYKIAGIDFVQAMGELYMSTKIFDEVWIYNVLQHTENPEKIIKNTIKMSKIIRIFEWIDTWVSPGHPHVLKEQILNKWLGGIGKVEELNESGCRGKSYYGIFKGNYYEE